MPIGAARCEQAERPVSTTKANASKDTVLSYQAMNLSLKGKQHMVTCYQISRSSSAAEDFSRFHLALCLAARLLATTIICFLLACRE